MIGNFSLSFALLPWQQCVNIQLKVDSFLPLLKVVGLSANLGVQFSNGLPGRPKPEPQLNPQPHPLVAQSDRSL